MNKLIRVSEKSFYNYINKHYPKEVPGEVFHSSYYLDEQGEKVAYMETSSWGPETVYKLREDIPNIPYSNVQTINVVASLFNKKQK